MGATNSYSANTMHGLAVTNAALLSEHDRYLKPYSPIKFAINRQETVSKLPLQVGHCQPLSDDSHRDESLSSCRWQCSQTFDILEMRRS